MRRAIRIDERKVRGFHTVSGATEYEGLSGSWLSVNPKPMQVGAVSDEQEEVGS